jgi:L-alanine-DL-glutamate epimerase-like enolase superfamily enzyme
MTVIESVETIPLRVPLEHLYSGSYYRMRNRCTIITRIRTSDGVVGEAYNADSDEEQAEILSIINDEIVPRVVGMDVMAVEKIWRAMFPVTLDQLRDRRLPMQAMASIDSAVWDAVGKYCGQPLWKLWGGYRDRIPMIGIGGYYGTSEADLERELGFFQGEHGMVGMKFKIGGKAPEIDAERLRIARSIVGEDFVFVVDANQGYSLAEAVEFVRVLGDDVKLRWFEEPTRWNADWRGLRDMRLITGVPVAAGQSEISSTGMRELIVNGAIDVSNYDASWGGGPTEWRRVAALTQSFDVEVGHHEEAQVASHLLASVPNSTFVESFSPTRDPIFWHLIENRPALIDGEFPLPTDPGFGWRLDEAFIAKHRL